MNIEVKLAQARSRAMVSTRGASLWELVLDQVVLTPKPVIPTNPYMGATLAPWPNRIKNGRYQWQSEELQLSKNDPLWNALHGFVFKRDFEFSTQTDSTVVFQYQLAEQLGYPWSLRIETKCELSDRGLEVSIQARNTSNSAAPVGLGTHPFFRRDRISILTVHARSMAVHGTDMIPRSLIDLGASGFAQRPFGSQLDSHFAGCSDIAATLSSQHGTFDIWQKNVRMHHVEST